MNFKKYFNLKEETLVDKTKQKMQSFSKQISDLMVKNPFDSRIATLQSQMKALDTAIQTSHAGNIISIGKRLEDMLSNKINLKPDVPENKRIPPSNAKDLKTEKDTLDRQVYEIGQLLCSQKDEDFEKIKLDSKLANNAEDYKSLNDKVRMIRKAVEKSQKEARLGIKPPEMFGLGRAGKSAVDALEGQPVKQKAVKLSPIEKLATKILRGIKQDDEKGKQKDEPSIDIPKLPQIPEIKKPINLDAQEKFLDDNKNEISEDLYKLAKDAIVKAKSTNSEDDINLAKDLVTNALDSI